MIGEPKPESWKDSVDYQEAISYMPKPPDFDIQEETAKEEIIGNSPDLEVATIESFGESMGNRAFLVNSEHLFRFPRSERAARSFQMEIALLPELQRVVSLPIPNPEYVGRTANGLPFLGYKLIPGETLEPDFIRSPDGTVKPHLAQQISQFFREVHSFDREKARGLGVPERNLLGKYSGELERAREILYPLLERESPDQAQQLKDFIEKRFSEYFADSRNFEYEPTFLHGDLESEHIMYSPEQDKITGVIDFGGAEISDPDLDLWRPYFHYGREFIEELLKTYPHRDPEFLFHKMDFYMTAQVVHRLVRSILAKRPSLPSSLAKFQEWALEGKGNLR